MYLSQPSLSPPSKFLIYMCYHVSMLCCITLPYISWLYDTLYRLGHAVNVVYWSLSNVCCLVYSIIRYCIHACVYVCIYIYIYMYRERGK